MFLKRISQLSGWGAKGGINRDSGKQEQNGDNNYTHYGCRFHFFLSAGLKDNYIIARGDKSKGFRGNHGVPDMLYYHLTIFNQRWYKKPSWLNTIKGERTEQSNLYNITTTVNKG